MTFCLKFTIRSNFRRNFKEIQKFPTGIQGRVNPRNSRMGIPGGPAAHVHDMSVRQIQVEVTNAFRPDRSGSGDIESAC